MRQMIPEPTTTRIAAVAVAGLLLVVGVAGVALAQDATTTESTFDTDDDGWTVQGDAETIEANYNASGGNPGGYIFAEDTVTGGTYYWNAPAKYLGNRSSSYEGTLSFDLRQSATSSQFDDDDIVLTSEERSLTYDFGNESTHPGTSWTSYSIDLRASAGWVNESGGNATESEMRAVLSNLTELLIRGEYRSGSDTGSLDNVVMTGAPSETCRTPPVGDFARPPTDPDGDARCENVNGDEAFDVTDVQALFANYEDDSTVQDNPEEFNFNGDTGDEGNELVDVVDVQRLFIEEGKSTERLD
jgi:hypothetical protein